MDAIEFSEQDRKELIEYYSAKLNELEAKAKHCQNLLNKLKGETKTPHNSSPLTEALGEIVSKVQVQSESIADSKVNKIIPRQNWKKISLNALREIDSFSTTYDIYEFLVLSSPEFIQYDKSDVVSKISTALSNLYSKNTIERIKNTLGRGYFWALHAWYSPELIEIYKLKLIKKYGVDESTFFPSSLGPPKILVSGDLPDFDDDDHPPF